MSSDLDGENARIILRRSFALKEIPGLDALRATAVIMVVLFHQGLPVSGDLGVTMFFVLSGFLITRILLREIGKTKTISLRNFYWRRSLRIFPAYYLCWIITTGLVLLRHQPIIPSQVVESFFYLTNYGRAVLPIARQVNFHMGIGWSLAIEEQFYLLWPLGLLVLIRRGKDVARFLSVGIVVIVLWRIILTQVFHVGLGYVYNAFDTRSDALLVGCWMTVSIERGMMAPYLRFLKKRWFVLLSLLALVIISFLDTYEGAGKIWLVSLTFAPILCGLLLLQLALWGSLGWPFLEHWSVKLIARLSYSIYLYHPLVMSLQRSITIRHAQRIAVLPIILGVAAASYYLVERPILRFRDRGKAKSVLMDDGIRS